MTARTYGSTTYTDSGQKLAHRTDRSRELCIMACVFCRDPQFWAWMKSLSPDTAGAFDEHAAKAFILSLCNVTSRNALDTDPDAATRFHARVRVPFIEWKEEQLC